MKETKWISNLRQQLEEVDKFSGREQQPKQQQQQQQQQHQPQVSQDEDKTSKRRKASKAHEAQQPKRRPAKRDEGELNLSFCGCGFLGIYHVGVASCFHEYAPQLSMHKISGSSAGALVAIAHICGNLQLAYATTDILRVAIDARARTLGPFHPSFDINATIREALERGLPEDIHLRASGKLHVSLTRVYDGQNVIISDFHSKEEVIQVLICSCFIPIWSGLKAPKFRGVTYIDGGFSNNLLTLDDKTVTVSPFAGEADICPQDDTLNLLQISLSNTSFSISPDNLYRLSHALLPPAPEVLSSLCEQGFADGIRFLQRMKLISCTKCLEIRSSLLVTTNGDDMEEAVRHELNEKPAAGEQHAIRLEHQEQKMIEINDGNRRRDSIVSTTSSTCYQAAAAANSARAAAAAARVAAAATAAGISFSNLLATSSNEDSNDTTNHNSNSNSNSNNNNNNNNNPKPNPIVHLNDQTYDEISMDETMEQDVDEINCHECVRIRAKASKRKNLPKLFSDRIRDACDTVNKSLSNWIYSHRPIKYMSYLMAPYYLPLEISLALVCKCWQSLPSIWSDLVDCVKEIVGFLIEILKRTQLTRSTSALLMDSVSGSSYLTWSDEEAAAEAKAIERQKESSRRKLAASNVSAKDANDLAAEQTSGSTGATNDFSLKITSDGLCVSRRVSNASQNHASWNQLQLQQQQSQQQQQQPQQQQVDTCSCTSIASSSHNQHSLDDTFDSIVDVTSNQEARIFAYYFRDAKNRLQVTEIFDLQRAAELSAAAAAANSSQQQQQQQQPQPQTQQQQQVAASHRRH